MGQGGGQQGRSQRGSGSRQNSSQLAALTSAEQEGLIHMREEEKLARDVYLTMAERWNTPVFSNIARSESVHMGALGNQIQQHGLLDPVTDDSIGAFTNPKFTQLYEELVAAGSVSIEGAYEVGRQIEILDIEDLDAALEGTQNETLRRIYQNLRRGSENHLRAFSANL